MFQIKLSIAVFAEYLLLVSLEADVLATIQNIVEKIELLVAPPDQLIFHPVVYVKQIVCIFTSILDHVFRNWSIIKK